MDIEPKNALTLDEMAQMNSSTDIRNQLIDQLMTISDRDFLMHLSNIISEAKIQSSMVALTEEQKLLLAMSDADIAQGNVIEQSVLHERELQWLKGK
jgi:hypothetical protein